MPADAPKQEASRRILIVDDEASVRTVFKNFLELSHPNLIIDTAVNGREAVACLETNPYLACILDLDMPEMDGLTAFHAMREACRTNGAALPPILFCSGYAPSPLLERIAWDFPHCRIVCKPVPMTDIAEFIQSALDAGD